MGHYYTIWKLQVIDNQLIVFAARNLFIIWKIDREIEKQRTV
jgi:hypothetical protein